MGRTIIPTGWGESLRQSHADARGRCGPDSPLSSAYFSRLCKQSTGLSPHHYLLRQRVERAKHILANPQHQIAEVSDALGFPHQSHFATTFRALVGVTPRAYQRQRGGE
jgi:AraC-like DNA-binding protein